MESLTKPKVFDDQLRAIAKKHLDDASATFTELKDGWFNAAYRVKRSSGDDLVLKIAPPPEVKLLRYEENILQVEVETMRLVAAKTDVPVPKIFAYDRERKEVDCEYFFMEVLEGVPYNTVRSDFAEDQQRSIHNGVGMSLRSLHDLKGESFGLYNRPIYSTWADAFRHMWDDLRQDGADLDVDLPDGAFEAGESLFEVLEVVETPSFVHWDLWDGNIFVDGGRLTGIIDFERAMWADPLIETTFLEDRVGLLEGYGVDIKTLPFARERRLLYDLYLFLIMVIETKFRGFTPEHEAWPRGKLTETLAEIRSLR